MKYRTVYKRTIADGVDNNHVRGLWKGAELDYFSEPNLCLWSTAVIESSIDGHVYKVIGYAFCFHGDDEVKILTFDRVLIFNKIDLKRMMERQYQWVTIQNEAIQSVSYK